MKNNNPNSILITKSKESNLKSIFKTPPFKISKPFLVSHLMLLKKKSSNSPKTSKKTEKNITNKKEIKILTNILEWSLKVWLKFNKLECHFNNKSWWKSVSNNTILLNTNNNLVLSYKNKWWVKVLDQHLVKSLHLTKLKEPSIFKLITWLLTVNKWPINWSTLAEDGHKNKKLLFQHWSVFTLLMKYLKIIQKLMKMICKVLKVFICLI